jgi:hypothetical protein
VINGMWNVGTRYRAGSITAVAAAAVAAEAVAAAAGELARYKLDFMGEQFRWDKGAQ